MKGRMRKKLAWILLMFSVFSRDLKSPFLSPQHKCSYENDFSHLYASLEMSIKYYLLYFLSQDMFVSDKNDRNYCVGCNSLYGKKNVWSPEI